MCCFSRPVRHVSQTQIFARSAPSGRQILVYSMNVELAEDLAMVLPLPTPPGAPEDALQFLDLSGYPGFFRDLGAAFPEIVFPAPRGSLLARSAPEPPRLKVHAVGDFEASFVPSRRDFERLDERFRLPPRAWDALPEYRDYGFAVFKLRRPRGLSGWLRRTRTIHPMAMEFPRRDARSLFFPTVHVHDGQRRPEAAFDHSLYCQPDPEIALLFDWERSEQPLGRHVDERRAAGVIDAGAHAYRRVVVGRAPNRDVVLNEAEIRAGVVLGELYLLRLGVAEPAGAAPAAPWGELAPADRERLKEALSRRLTTLTRAQRDAWQLIPYRGDLPDRWPTLYEAFPDAGAPPRDAPCRVKFFVWSQRVAPQEISLAFSAEPSNPLREAISTALQQAFEEVSAR